MINRSILFDPEQWRWTTESDFMSILSAMDAENLDKKSKSARAYFFRLNQREIALSRILNRHGIELQYDGEADFQIEDLLDLWNHGYFPSHQFWHRTPAGQTQTEVASN